MRFLATVLWSASALLAQGVDYSADLLQAAMRGRSEQVKAFLDDGASLEAVDASGRTPLMLAAQHGQAATVELLLGRGANAFARDREGATAYSLAMFDSVGHGKREAVLKLLPKPPRPKMAIEVKWSPVKLVGSCFGTRETVTRTVDDAHLDDKFLRAFGAYVQASGHKLVELVGLPADADGLLRVELQPASACVPPGGDSLSLVIAVQILREPGGKVVFERTFGGAIKRLNAPLAANLRQYAPIFQPWVQPHAGPIYWAAAAELYRIASAR